MLVIGKHVGKVECVPIKGYIKTFKVKHLIVTKSLADLEGK